MNDDLANNGQFGEFIVCEPWSRNADLDLLRYRYKARCEAEEARIGKPVYPGPGSKVVDTGNRIEVIVNLTTDRTQWKREFRI
jgi:hypothetical protein